MDNQKSKNNISLKQADGVTPEESFVERAAEELKISLPQTDLPWVLKIIALFALVGGLSIIGSSFADIFGQEKVGFGRYILRLGSGIAFLLIAYGLVEKRRWAVWLYGFLVVVGLWLNFYLAIFPALIVAYLYFRRRHFRPSLLDVWLIKQKNILWKRYLKIRGRESL